MIRSQFLLCLLLLQQCATLIQSQSSNDASGGKARFISSTIASTALHHGQPMYGEEDDDEEDFPPNTDSYDDEDEEGDFDENHFSSTSMSYTDFPNMTAAMKEDASIGDYEDEAGSYQEETDDGEPRVYADTMSVNRPDSRRPPLENSIGTSSTSRISFVHPNLWKDFFSKPTILVGMIGGISLGALSAILLVMFIIYRMRKKDEGSYALEEAPRKSPSQAYTRVSSREFFA